MFPVIRSIDDVLPVIQGNENFVVNKKEGYIVIDYLLNTSDTFKNPIERECRGIIFDESHGGLLRRPYHKFFNYNERPETQVVDIDRPHTILEKLDGSMIAPFYVNGTIIWGSKAGRTFLTPQIEEFVVKNTQYQTLAHLMVSDGFTPIFEWCTRQNTIVIDYPQDRLVLTGIRNLITGRYMLFDVMQFYAKQYNIDCVRDMKIWFDFENIQSLSNSIRVAEGIEGFVLRFEDSGLMIKMKADRYVDQHRAKDNINLEKNVVSVLVNNLVDDVKGLLSERDRLMVEAFEKDFFDALIKKAQEVLALYNDCKISNQSRKDFAFLSKNWKFKFYRSIIFEFWDKPEVTIQDVYYHIINIIKKSCGSQTSIDNVRELWNNLKWVDYRKGEVYDSNE